MSILVCEAHDLVFNRRAVARSARIDLPRVHRRAMQVRTNHIMYLLVRVSDIARHLRLSNALRQVREGLRIVISGLEFGGGKIDRLGAQARRRACFEAIQSQTDSSPVHHSSPAEVPSPARPPAVLASPVCISACKKVPVVITTAVAR